MKLIHDVSILVLSSALLGIQAEAQAGVTFTMLASFEQQDGPAGELLQARDGDFYGTTVEGGDFNFGTVFRVNPDWTISSLFSFNSNNGANPRCGLAQSLSGDVVFYGTTTFGGANGLGTAFKLLPDGTFTSLFDFSGTDGANPEAGVTWNGSGNLVGVTYYGGTNGWPSAYGTIFEMTTGGALTTVHSFDFQNGLGPYGSLVQGPDGNSYGTTQLGGSDSLGTVFKITPAGEFTSLVSFHGTNGALPQSRLAVGNDGNLYGTTYYGGLRNLGTIFRITTSGDLTTVLSFTETNGSKPFDGLTLGADGAFYGTTSQGGTADPAVGTAFRLAPDGTLTTLVSFDGTNGRFPVAGLTRGTDGSLYGTTQKGGANDKGTLFRLTMTGAAAPVLHAEPAGNQIALSWDSVVDQAYQVQYKTDLSETTWHDLGGPVTATGTTTTVYDDIGPDARRFYRVQVQ